MMKRDLFSNKTLPSTPEWLAKFIIYSKNWSFVKPGDATITHLTTSNLTCLKIAWTTASKNFFRALNFLKRYSQTITNGALNYFSRRVEKTAKTKLGEAIAKLPVETFQNILNTSPCAKTLRGSSSTIFGILQHYEAFEKCSIACFVIHYVCITFYHSSNWNSI